VKDSPKKKFHKNAILVENGTVILRSPHFKPKPLVESFRQKNYNLLNDYLSEHPRNYQNIEDVLKKGYDLNYRSPDLNINDGFFFLMYNNYCDPVLFGLFVHYKWNVNCKREDNQKTPLHIAVERELINHVELLLIYGADTSARDKNRDTPLHLLHKVRYYKVAEFFLLFHSCRPNWNIYSHNKRPLELVDYKYQVYFQKFVDAPKKRWKILRCCARFLSLHHRAVVSANHPDRLRERGDFEM